MTPATRRAWLRTACGLAGGLLAGGARATASLSSADAAAALAAIERRVGGRLGLCAFDTASGASVAWRADERFAMCSTFKLPLVGAVLALVDTGALRLDQRVRYGRDDLVPYAPVASKHLADGAMTLDGLCEAAITLSDNVAANLLLRQVDGPAGLTAFLRHSGDAVTRLDRIEPALNENRPGDPRDTTTPRAMAQTVQRLLVGPGVLTPASRGRLAAWLVACETGRDRLRAGLPADWRVGDKTGTGRRGAANDVAIAWPPGRSPVIVACYLSDSAQASEQLDRAHADAARVVGRRLRA